MTQKILVIGAGASGLMAAHCLTGKGYGVSVIEARDRLGGRIHAMQNNFSRPIETGAEFMHGKQPLTESLIKAADAEAILLSGKRYQLWSGQRKQGNFFGDEWNLLTQELAKLITDTDMDSFLREHFDSGKFKRLRQKVEAFVEGFDAADLHRVSALALKKEWEQSDDEHQYHIKGGYVKLIDHMAKNVTARGGEILLSSPVRDINWSPGRVTATTQGGSAIEGEKVIITVPLGVLQKNHLRFSPALPEHSRMFAQMGFGGVIKIFIEFTDTFWESNITHPLKDVAFIFSDAEIPTWWSQLPDRTPLLTGWLGGPSTFTITGEPEELFGKALMSLEYIFKHPVKEIRKYVREWHIANWTTDPFTFGAYAYPTVGNKNAQGFISSPVQDTLFFAGEAIYEGAAMGTVEAALISGKYAAGKIMHA